MRFTFDLTLATGTQEKLQSQFLRAKLEVKDHLLDCISSSYKPKEIFRIILLPPKNQARKG